jgi:hypothetical protein
MGHICKNTFTIPKSNKVSEEEKLIFSKNAFDLDKDISFLAGYPTFQPNRTAVPAAAAILQPLPPLLQLLWCRLPPLLQLLVPHKYPPAPTRKPALSQLPIGSTRLNGTSKPRRARRTMMPR